MSGKESGPSASDNHDKDVRAVRNLMSQNEAGVPKPPDAQNRFVPLEEPIVQENTTPLVGYVPPVIRNYNPETVAILRTSLAVLLMLRPFTVFGLLFLAIFVLLLVYLFAGPYRFWRGVISFHGFIARYKPSTARVIKLRAYVVAKRWDELLLWAPQGLADFLRSPDLREMVRADKRHHQAYNERLDRLT